MFALPGICALIFFIYVRPQEIVPDLQRLPLLYLFFALSLFGLAVDLRLRVNKASPTPQLLWVGMLFVWCALSTGLNAPSVLIPTTMEFAVAVTLYLVLAHSIHTFRAYQLVVGMMVGLVICLAFIGVHQGTAPWGCVRVDPSSTGDLTVGSPDGRSCRPLSDLDCYLRGEPEPGADYICERIGLVGTTSVAGRVRYRGVLQDPNELAMILAIGMPFAFAFASRRRTWLRRSIAVMAFALVALCIYFTQSRGGQLVFASVLGIYAIWRWRWKAVVVLAMLAPIGLLLIGGGGREDAAASTEERYEAWMTGFDLFRSSPLFGVGQGQFVEYHYLTAHNSYVLALAEVGLVGLLLWGSVLYLSVKVPLIALIRYHDRPEAQVAVSWSLATLASLAGLMVGIMFLSFSWHFVFWIYMGLSGALYSAIRTHDRDFRISLGWRDLGLVAALAISLMAALFVYLRFKGY